MRQRDTHRERERCLRGAPSHGKATSLKSEKNKQPWDTKKNQNGFLADTEESWWVLIGANSRAVNGFTDAKLP